MFIKYETKNSIFINHTKTDNCFIISFHFTENCIDEFVCYISLFTHLVVEHAAKKYTCPHCFTTMECTKTELIEHFKQHPYGLEEYQCLYCSSGFNDVDGIRKHMSQKHSSNFLYIGSRISQKSRNSQNRTQFETDEPQIVYIGNTCDISSYTFAKCNDISALVRMDPNELDPSKQNEFYITNQSLRIKEPLREPIPAILYRDTQEFIDEETSTLDQYEQPKKSPKKTIQRISNASPNQPSESISFDPLPSTSKIEQQLNISPIVKQTSTEYKCITHQSATDLTTIYGNYKSRTCEYCMKFMKLDDRLSSYLEHLIVEHACKSITNMKQVNDVKEIIQHRIICHKDEQIVFLQIEQSPHTVYKVVKCKFECEISKCCTRFDTRQKLEAHTFQEHEDKFIQAKIVQEITVVESNETREINVKEENVDLSYCTLFTCSEHDEIQILGSKSNALSHYNEYHNITEATIFKASIFQSVQESRTIRHFKQENDQDHRMYVFKCHHCRKLLGAKEHVGNHNCLNQNDIRFSISKLVAHPTKKMIMTFEDMQKYNQVQNPQQLLTSLNVISKRCCGLCTYKYENLKDLEQHYRRKHSKGEILSQDLLNSLYIEPVEVGECQYQAGCCSNIQRKTIKQIVRHTMACGKRRFICQTCPNKSFDTFMQFVTHLMIHYNSIDHICGKIYDCKSLLALFSDMIIIFPYGLAVTWDAVSTLEFGSMILNSLLTDLNEFTKTERNWLRIMNLNSHHS